MAINLDRLEAFVVASEAGSFSAAARVLGKAQSSLSEAISQLEIELGLDLFDRSTRIPRLTPAGERMVLEARTVLDRARAFESQAAAFAAGTTDSLTISVSVPLRTIVEPLQEFAGRYPYTNLVVRSPLGTGRASEDVLAGRAAIGVAFTDPDYDRALGFRRLGNLILMHVVHRSHVLAGRRRLSFADMREHRRLLYAEAGTLHPTAEYLQTAQTWRIHDYGVLMEMARAGLGWATVPRQFVVDGLASGEFVELRLDAYEHTDWLVGVDLLYRRDGRHSEPELWLRDRLASHRVFELDAPPARVGKARPCSAQRTPTAPPSPDP
ncbi:LysR family transcriptional regulator [Streptomyces sp. NPDC015127]|uniref:LysR family transcriptional regulator n=1 Tax=Streptomyces sp. NPDC015127 TaxID=3364939 RepID=UPI0036F76EBD